MRPDRAYEGLMLARRKLFDWVKLLSQEQYTKQMPTGLHTLRATMVEMCRGEWIYSLRLRGETPPPRDQWPISEDKQPTFADLERVWTDQAKRTPSSRPPATGAAQSSIVFSSQARSSTTLRRRATW